MTEPQQDPDAIELEMNVGEWADRMLAALQNLPVIQAVTAMARLNQEQRDILRARLQQKAES